MTDDPNVRRGDEGGDEGRDPAPTAGDAQRRADDPARTDAAEDEPRVIHLGQRSFANTNIAADQRERDREREEGGLKASDRRSTQDSPERLSGRGEVPEDEWD